MDLDLLSSELEGDKDMSSGGWLDLRTGQVHDDADTDPAIVGDDATIDVEDDPDRWRRIERTGSRDGWKDMAAFAERHHDTQLRETLMRAIEGKGAFRRFRTSSTTKASPKPGAASPPTGNTPAPARSSPPKASGRSPHHHSRPNDLHDAMINPATCP